MFEVLEFDLVSTHIARENYCGMLNSTIDFSRRLLTGLRTDIRASRLPECCCIHSKLTAAGLTTCLIGNLKSIFSEYPLKMESPFEGVESIAGGVWKSEKMLDENADDALVKLCFEAATENLPVHSHEYSDRVIYVIEGWGIFEFRSEHNSKYEVRRITVEEGHILAFTRGLMHTFWTLESKMVLLSFHSPFIELDDPRQFKVV